jgi:diguanylate cyclase (GGDEF)-like protein/PAS domain S-box-containing protein
VRPIKADHRSGRFTVEEELRLQRLQRAADLSSDWYWETDANYRFTYVSDGLTRSFGIDPSEVLGKVVWELEFIVDKAPMEQHRSTLEAHRPFKDFTYAVKRPLGDVGHISRSGQPMFDERRLFQGYCGVSKDVTKWILALDELAKLAHHDGLTGLPNRLLAKDRLQFALARAQRSQKPLAVALFSLTAFKEINESLGHSAGDEVLREIAHRLKVVTRSSDTTARMGGDEFLLLLEDIAEAVHILPLIKRAVAAVTERMDIGGRELYCAVGVGIAVYPVNGADADSLLRNAGLAMRKAKQDGRNVIVGFTPEMQANASSTIDVHARLRRALDGNDLLLHYQPQICFKTAKIVGVEALLRWNDKKRGLIPPREFIPVAEDTGLILEIGDWVIQAACEQAKAWHDAGMFGLRMAVNLSPKQFRQLNLAKKIGAILETSRLPPGCLELEITETSLMHGTESVLKNLNELYDLGVRVAVDDFGTGYSSLSYLHRFPVQVLKIDQSFVRGILNDYHSAALAGTIITLGKQLNIETVAEGVETEQQHLFLKHRGCDAFQGYYFSRALPASDIEKVLSSNVLGAEKGRGHA